MVPTGYVTIPEAAKLLAQPLFGGIPDRPLVTKLRRAGRNVEERQRIAEARSELWKAEDAEKLRVVAMGGKPQDN